MPRYVLRSDNRQRRLCVGSCLSIAVGVAAIAAPPLSQTQAIENAPEAAIDNLVVNGGFEQVRSNAYTGTRVQGSGPLRGVSGWRTVPYVPGTSLCRNTADVYTPRDYDSPITGNRDASEGRNYAGIWAAPGLTESLGGK